MARIRDDFAFPSALLAGRVADGLSEYAVGHPFDLACTAARRTCLDIRAVLRSFPVTVRARNVLLQRDFFLDSLRDFLQGQFYPYADVPALYTFCCGPWDLPPPNPPKPPNPPLNPPNPPPNRLFRMSFRSPNPPLKSGPGCPPSPAWPNWSYFALLSLSLRTEYASAASLNFSSASLFPDSCPDGI